MFVHEFPGNYRPYRDDPIWFQLGIFQLGTVPVSSNPFGSFLNMETPIFVAFIWVSKLR